MALSAEGRCPNWFMVIIGASLPLGLKTLRVLVSRVQDRLLQLPIRDKFEKRHSSADEIQTPKITKAKALRIPKNSVK